MALVLIQPGIEPIGQWDAYASDSFLGGEVMQLRQVAITAQGGAADNLDGYLSGGTAGSPTAGTGGVNKKCLTRELTAGIRPLYLSDDGTANYGTVLGAIVGGVVGTEVNNPSLSTYSSLFGVSSFVGPATYVGSGRVTAWGKPGTYGVTLDACDSGTTGLQPTNTSLYPGSPLFAAKSSYTTPGAGVLTPNPANSFEGNGTSAGLVVAYFVEFRTKGALVTTPNRLVSALNSPSTVIGGTLPNTMYMAVFEWIGAQSGNYLAGTGFSATGFAFGVSGAISTGF